jgi:hypothetical protein
MSDFIAGSKTSDKPELLKLVVVASRRVCGSADALDIRSITNKKMKKVRIIQ